jgi:nucleotide-binding universal stress UspA family protein
MYKKILIATDGSTISRIAALAGVEFARQIRADVVGFSAARHYEAPPILGIPPSYQSEAEYTQKMQAVTTGYLDVIKKPVEAAGLRFEAVNPLTNKPAVELIKAAERLGCDVIFMGSHGRGGLGRLLLGSVTADVLANCCIPVLVYRTTGEEMFRAENPVPAAA